MEAAVSGSSFRGTFFSDRSWGIFLAAAVHTSLFIAGGLSWMHKAEYGMDFSNGAAEVDLIAAPAPEASARMPSVRDTAPTMPATPDPDDIAEQAKTPALAAPPAAAAVPNALAHTSDLSGPLGDGSSLLPGKDATTLHRAGSSGSYFKPGYYRNPPPAYPAEARKLKQEGRVLLEVHITTQGSVSSVRIKQSSGFPLLDGAAQHGIEHWKFRAARMAGIAMETDVEIPIRFQLK